MKPIDIRSADWYYYNALFILEHLFGYNRFEKYFGSNRKRLYAKIDKYLEGRNRGSTREVEQVDKKLSKQEFLQQCYEPVLPKVFRAAANDWKAVKEWNLDFFE